MDAHAKLHPTDHTLSSYGLGKLDDALAEAVNQHLEGCDSCQRRVAELSSDEFLGRLRQAGVMPDKAASGWSPSAGSSTDGSARPVAPPSVETLPPELVDHPDWEIVRELGRGGMGVVYLANNRLMGRPEVLKVVGRHLIERPGVADRFLREIRSAAKLQHPNIVTAYSARHLGQSVVFAMEYVKGFDLSKLVKSHGPLPITHSCHFIHQAALGLQHALENEMVHRDIKPANLIVKEGKKGILKVLDFGLAKVTSEGQTDSNLTREGQMVGTPDFIAPEQIRDAKAADIRADIYSLGCTLHYLLAGNAPFRGDHLWDVYQAHFSMDAGPLNLVRPEVPVELAAVVAKMMAKEPARRFQTPGEVARALTPFFRPSTSQPPGSSTEVSRAGTQVAPTRSSNAVAVPTHPAALTAAPSPAGERPPKTGADEVPWGSLIAIKEDGPLIEAPKPKRAEPKPAPTAAQVRRPPWVRPAIVAASLFAVLALGVIVYVVTDKGRIKIVIDGPEPIVTIDGGTVHIKGPDEPITLRAGERKMIVKWRDGQFDTRKFTVRRGDNAPLRIEYEPRPTVIDRAETKPWNSPPTETVPSDIARPAPAALEKPPVLAEVPGIADKPKAVGKIPAQAPPTVDKPPTPPGPVATRQRVAGFRALFNGKDKAGWRMRAGQPDNWRVEKGVLIGSGSGVSHLDSERGDFKDFHLRVYARINQDGNSGIFFREPVDGGRGMAYYEVQIGHRNGALNVYGRPDGNARTPPKFVDAHLPLDAWFTLDVIADANHLVTILDGRVVAEFLDENLPLQAGTITLEQCPGTVVEFRKIEIRELAP
jgi:serine/threonine protein kinase